MTGARSFETLSYAPSGGIQSAAAMSSAAMRFERARCIHQLFVKHAAIGSAARGSGARTLCGALSPRRRGSFKPRLVLLHRVHLDEARNQGRKVASQADFVEDSCCGKRDGACGACGAISWGRQ